jgi:hypothetical protein
MSFSYFRHLSQIAPWLTLLLTAVLSSFCRERSLRFRRCSSIFRNQVPPIRPSPGLWPC